jgi:hypothetical protein
MPGTKPTNAELKRRVNTVSDLLLMGSSRAEILQYIAEKTPWGISERTIDDYIARATEAYRKVAEFHREEQLGKAIRRLEMLFLRAMKVQDFQRALATQRELNALLGLYAPTKMEHTGENGNAIRIEVVREKHDPTSPLE